MAGLPPLRVAAASAETPISAKQARRNARAAKRADREVRKRGKAAAKKRREREIKERQWQSRKLREDNKSVATQRVQRMYNDEYRPWVNGGAAVAHPRLPHGPGNIEMRTARGSDPETMLFTLLSKRAETTHPALQGYTALRSTCRPGGKRRHHAVRRRRRRRRDDSAGVEDRPVLGGRQRPSELLLGARQHCCLLRHRIAIGGPHKNVLKEKLLML